MLKLVSATPKAVLMTLQPKATMITMASVWLRAITSNLPVYVDGSLRFGTASTEFSGKYTEESARV